MFLRARVEDHQSTGAKTFELTDVMLAQPAPLVQSAPDPTRRSHGTVQIEIWNCARHIDLSVIFADSTKRVKSLFLD
jgi:hypothetical protein